MKSTEDMKEGAAQALFNSVEFKPLYSAPIMLLFFGGLQLKIYMLPRSMGSMHGVISGEGLRMLNNFRRS